MNQRFTQRRKETSQGAKKNFSTTLCFTLRLCVKFLSFSRWTLLRVFRSILRQQPAQVCIVSRFRIAEPTDLVNRSIHLSKTEMLLQFDDQRYLVTLPTTRQPPARIGIDKHAPPVIDV